MRSFGAELMEHGRDFDEAKERGIASERGLEYAPSFHRDFVIGVATYAHELFSAVDDLDTVYVPIGLGSGICGLIGTRDALGLKTKAQQLPTMSTANQARTTWRPISINEDQNKQRTAYWNEWSSAEPI
jgi:threonine dehydratase